MTCLIELNKVSVRYKLKRKMKGSDYYQPLKDISFDVIKGETLGIIGRNGTGKSTLLKLLSKIYSPDSGSIKYQKNLSVSLLTLQAGFDLELSGYDNILFTSLLLGFEQKEVVNNIDKIIEFSELEDFIYQPVKTYSSGMRSKLGFSIAVQMKPDVLLIDEALSVGDAKFRKKAESVMVEKINSDQTVVFVSHSANQIKRLCDRVIWIDDGVVRQIGDADKVIYEYEK
ncbi:ABC transporter ATP-binding protein [Vibrio splendidus]|uniref:ABC transporter ATP-binding protein n=1 Tax=Vibrio splendidus TaxID=29497 RepID=UPI00076ABA41|nr:ABC transporter ATP-binding protein [Vibrio splendidus]